MSENFLQMVVSALTFSTLGILMFGAVWWILIRVTPFSIRKEIEEDQNVALGIVLGSVILGVALIVAAAIHG